jgi:hypothetical protein
LSLVGYLNIDRAGNTDNRKNTTRGCFYVGGNLTV